MAILINEETLEQTQEKLTKWKQEVHSKYGRNLTFDDIKNLIEIFTIEYRVYFSQDIKWALVIETNGIYPTLIKTLKQHIPDVYFCMLKPEPVTGTITFEEQSK